jgi:hypothetical protein
MRIEQADVVVVGADGRRSPTVLLQFYPISTQADVPERYIYDNSR